MCYNVNFSIASVCFLSVCIVFFFSKKRIPSKTNRMYIVMIFSSLSALLFDGLASYLDYYALSVNSFYLYLFNMLGIISMHLCLFYYVCYIFHFANIKLNKFSFSFLVAPFFIVIIFTICSPICRYCIFYLDENNHYVYGSSHMVLYIVTVIYLITSVIVSLLRKSIIRKLAKVLIAFSVIIMICLAIFQMFNPTYLITASATSVGVVMIYFLLQSPDSYIDTPTNTFNRNAMNYLLEDYISNNKKAKAIVITIFSLSQINHIYGTEVEEKVLASVAKRLLTDFPKGLVFHVYHSTFIVLDREMYHDAEYFKYLLSLKPTQVTLDQIDVQYQIGAYVTNLASYHSSNDFFNVMDYSIREDLVEANQVLEMEDAKIKKYLINSKLEHDFLGIISTKGITISLEEIMDNKGLVYAKEIIPQISKENYQAISYDELRLIADVSNHSNELYASIFNLINELDKNENYLLRLSGKFLESNELLSLIDRLTIAHEKLNFSISEKNYASLTRQASDNIEGIKQRGYQLIIDDFGIGYNDTNSLFRVDIRAVRINHAKLIQRMSIKEASNLISLIIDIMSQMKIDVICTNLELDFKETIVSMGISYYQISN